MDLVQLAVGNMDEAGEPALRVEQRVPLQGDLGNAKVRPREHLQAPVDWGRILAACRT